MLTVAIDFYSMGEKYYRCQWLQSTKEDILKNVGKQLTVAIDFYSMGENTIDVNGYNQQKKIF